MPIRLIKVRLDDIPGLLRKSGARWQMAYADARSFDMDKVYVEIVDVSRIRDEIVDAIYTFDRKARTFRLLLKICDETTCKIVRPQSVVV